MEIEVSYKSSIIKYDSGDNLKGLTATIIYDFEVNTEMFNTLVRKLLDTHLFLPMRPIDFIHRYIGQLSQIYNAHFIGGAKIEFIDRLNYRVYFTNGFLNGHTSENALNGCGSESVAQIFEGNVSKDVILTNYRYASKQNETAETYHVSILDKN